MLSAAGQCCCFHPRNMILPFIVRSKVKWSKRTEIIRQSSSFVHRNTFRQFNKNQFPRTTHTNQKFTYFPTKNIWMLLPPLPPLSAGWFFDENSRVYQIFILENLDNFISIFCNYFVYVPCTCVCVSVLNKFKIAMSQFKLNTTDFVDLVVVRLMYCCIKNLSALMLISNVAWN